MLPDEQTTTPSTGLIDKDSTVDGEVSSEVSLAIHPHKSSHPFKHMMEGPLEEADNWSQSLDAQRISLCLLNTSRHLTFCCSCNNFSLTSSTLTNLQQCSNHGKAFRKSNQIYQYFIQHMQFSMCQAMFQDHGARTTR